MGLAPERQEMPPKRAGSPWGCHSGKIDPFVCDAGICSTARACELLCAAWRPASPRTQGYLRMDKGPGRPILFALLPSLDHHGDYLQGPGPVRQVEGSGQEGRCPRQEGFLWRQEVRWLAGQQQPGHQPGQVRRWQRRFAAGLGRAGDCRDGVPQRRARLPLRAHRPVEYPWASIRRPGARVEVSLRQYQRPTLLRWRAAVDSPAVLIPALCCLPCRW